MKIFEPLALRIALITSIAVWALFSLGCWLKGVGASPLHCLILGAMGLAITLPAGVEKLVRQKWFPLAMSMWMLVMIPPALFAFNASAGLGDKCAHLYIPLGVFGCAFTLVWWAVTFMRDRSRARKHPETQETRPGAVAESSLVESAR